MPVFNATHSGRIDWIRFNILRIANTDYGAATERSKDFELGAAAPMSFFKLKILVLLHIACGQRKRSMQLKLHACNSILHK